MQWRNCCGEVRQGIIWVHRVGEIMVRTPQSNSDKEDRISHGKDACVFIKGHGSKQVVTCVLVDDLMITCTDDEEHESVVSSLQKAYKALRLHRV